MHRPFVSWALTLSALAFTAAHAQDVVLEAALGSSKITSGNTALTDTASAVGLTVRRVGPSGFGIEGGVRAHGEWAVNLGPYTDRFDATSYMLGVTYDVPVGPVTLGARLGGHAWRLRGNTIGPGSQSLGKFEDSGSGLYYSFGASYAISERMSLGSHYNVFRVENGVEIKGLDIRLSYRF